MDPEEFVLDDNKKGTVPYLFFHDLHYIEFFHSLNQK